MSRFEIVRHAGDGEAFAPQAFDGSIGKTVPVKVEGGESGEAELVAAVVAEDGRSARLTFDTLDYHVEVQLPHPGDRLGLHELAVQHLALPDGEVACGATYGGRLSTDHLGSVTCSECQKVAQH